MPSVKSPFGRATFSNVPPLTKTVSTAMILLTALGLVLRFRDFAISDRGSTDSGSTYVDSEAALIPLVALVPVSAPYRLWTFATASFFERSIIKYALHSAILLGCGKYLERGWGSREFFKTLCISSIGTMVGIYLTCLFEYVIRGNDELLYDTQAYGLIGVLAGFLVGFKQLVPDHLITVWGALSVRVKSLPLIFIFLMAIDGLIAHSKIQFLMAAYGMFLSWVYARFLKVQDGIRGDRSETFSFASFFPEFMQPPVKMLSNVCFGILVKLHIFSPTGYGGSFQYDLENPQMAGMGHTFTQPGSLRAEAERRRGLALKALDMRLHAAAGNNASFSGPTRAGGSGQAAPVSLLSLSAEPLPTGDDSDEDEVLFESTVLDMNEPTSSSTTSQALPSPKRSSMRTNTNEPKSEKEML